MALLSGSISVTRFNISPIVDEPAFDNASFRAIQPGSEVRESAGFVPVEPEAPYQAAAGRWFFRVRFDRLRPDPTAVAERLKELIKTELDQGAEFVGSKRRKMLRELAEEELIVDARPRSKIIEGCIDGQVLYVGSTAKAYLGRVVELLRRIGIVAELKTPWLDRGDPEVDSSIVDFRDPAESVLGCRFLKALVGDRQILIEPEAGLVRLQTDDARVSLAGTVMPDLMRYIDRGAELLSAKLILAADDERGPVTCRFDAPGFRLAGLRVETDRHDHWTELLDERLEHMAAAWDLLDTRYQELAPTLLRD